MSVETVNHDGGAGGGSTVAMKYDATAMASLISAINISVVEPAAADLESSVDGTNEEIANVWKGAASEAFQTKLKSDTTVIAQTLRDMGASIKGALTNVGSNFEEYDDALAAQISNW